MATSVLFLFKYKGRILLCSDPHLISNSRVIVNLFFSLKAVISLRNLFGCPKSSAHSAMKTIHFLQNMRKAVSYPILSTLKAFSGLGCRIVECIRAATTKSMFADSNLSARDHTWGSECPFDRDIKHVLYTRLCVAPPTYFPTSF